MAPTIISKKETFTLRGYNASALSAGSSFVIQDIKNAETDGNLPHNTLFLANLDTTSTLFIFLNNNTDTDSPDYILYPSSTININLEDGVNFRQLYIKNTHATNEIAEKDIKYKVSTIKNKMSDGPLRSI